MTLLGLEDPGLEEVVEDAELDVDESEDMGLLVLEDC